MKASYKKGASNPRINESSFCGKMDPRAADIKWRDLLLSKETHTGLLLLTRYSDLS